MTTTVAIVGSRHFSDYAAFCALLADIPEANACDAVVSGGARGVDTMAARWASETERYLRVYVVNSERGTFSQRTHARNQNIADDLAANDGVLIALPGPKSKGTYDTVRRCKALGVKVIVKEVPE